MNEQDNFMSKQRFYEINACAADYFCYLLSTDDKDAKQARKYLENRGMTKKHIRRYEIGYAPINSQRLLLYLKKKGFSEQEIAEAKLSKTNDQHETYATFRHRIILPIRDEQNRVIGFGARKLPDSKSKAKYINTDETEVFKKGENLYSLNFAAKSRKKYFILVEGYFDVISLNMAGYDNTVATLGTALTSQQAALIHTYTDKVVILYDSDDAGRKATDRAIPLLEQVGVKVKILTLRGAKDSDEFIVKYGKDAFKSALKSSENATQYKISRIMQTQTDADDMLKQVLRTMLFREG